LTANQKKKMLFHLTLSFILENADDGEVFLVNTARDYGSFDADICSLDYGEALCGEAIFPYPFEDDVASRLESIIGVSQKYMTIMADFGKAEIEDGCLETVRRLAKLDMNKMASTFSDIERYFGKLKATWYREYFNDLKMACERVT